MNDLRTRMSHVCFEHYNGRLSDAEREKVIFEYIAKLEMVAARASVCCKEMSRYFDDDGAHFSRVNLELALQEAGFE